MSDTITDLKAMFAAKVKERLALHPTDWSGADSAKVVEAYIGSLTDDKGKPIVLTDFEKDVITVLSRPTFDVQVSIIKQMIEQHGGKFDPATEKRIKDIVNPTTFKKKLIENGHIKFGETDDFLG